MTVILGKLAMGVVLGAATLLALRSSRVAGLPFGSFSRLTLAASLILRLSVFVALYLALGYEVPSDVPTAYYPEAKAALAGELVYRDFFSTYAPLFPYVAAAAVAAWDSAKSLVLLAILLETLGLAIWLRVGGLAFPEGVVRRAGVLFAGSPLLVSTVAMAGQNHVWIGAFLATSVLLALRKHEIAAGVALGLGLLATKFLVIVFVPVVLLLSGRKRRFLGGFAGIVSAAYGTLALAGADILAPLTFQRSAGQESSGNLPYLLAPLGVSPLSSVYVLAALLVLGALCIAAWVRRRALSRGLLIATGVVLLFSIVLLLSKKSYTTYWASCFFPLCLWWAEWAGARSRAMAAFVGWEIVATLEPSLFFRWLSNGPLIGVVTLPPVQAVLYVCIQVAVIGFNVFLAAKCLRCAAAEMRWPRGA